MTRHTVEEVCVVPIDRRDASLLEDLYDAYGASCYRLAHRMVSEQELACAIVRDVFVAVWNGDAVLDPAHGSAEAWLLGATHRRAVLMLRRQRQLSIDGGARTEILAVLPKIDATQRVLELAYFGGRTQLEIAALTGTALGVIKTLTLAALRQLGATGGGRHHRVRLHVADARFAAAQGNRD